MYTCGPTIYNFAHIGNLRTFVFEDLLRRYLQYKGYVIRQVMNITDVDDKTIKGAQKEKIPLKTFTAQYGKAFYEDLKTLNIEPVEVYPAATAHIPEMVALIKRLMEKGVAYRANDGSIYFSIKKFKEYGKLAKIDLENSLTADEGFKANKFLIIGIIVLAIGIGIIYWMIKKNA